MKKIFIIPLLLFSYSCNNNTPNPNIPSSPSTNPVQKIAFSEVKKVFEQRCTSCHSTSRPSGNLSLEDNNQIKNNLQKINNHTVVQKTMPPGNSTNMSEEERNLITEVTHS
ncbi:MAG: hypothetical protein KatS3mg068_1992 [Candidatus Sericytochromatia bacterium]|nr:MAG: hypothetical protein KatS3mg068_1992 [Candidatus Sericytochromatia bacterium]